MGNSMAKTRSFFSRGRKVQTVDRLVLEHKHANQVLQDAGSSDGAEWTVAGVKLKNFASCSYMGLERHPDLIAGARAALEEFGSNFSISRIYLQCPLYAPLEDALSEMTDRHILVTPSTTLGHLAALPVIVGDKDVVIVDQFAHASIHMATDLVADVPIELLRHSRMDLLEDRLKELGDGVERVWYLCDGVYSMLGDCAPFEELSSLMRRYPKLHVYADDAHSISWAGRHGRGAVLSSLTELDRVVVAMSLNKAFGAVGGALAFPSAELRDRVQRCGGPLIFSGPIAPAGLGAGVASAKLHLSAQFADMQDELHERVAYARAAVSEASVPLATQSDTPILMVHYDSVPAAREVVRGLRERGFFVCISTFPAVPVNKPSMRFTISRHNSFADISDLVNALAEVTARRPLYSGIVGPEEEEVSVKAS
jgi:7-keto-8-aminopelargonate synthetase-like enzyme